jgi:hypothetical protein
MLSVVEAPVYKFSYTWHKNQLRGLPEDEMMEIHRKQVSWKSLHLSWQHTTAGVSRQNGYSKQYED